MNDAQKKQVVQTLYDKVIQTANEFLHSAKHIRIEILQMRDPSYADVAETIDRVCKVISLLCEDVQDPLTGQKAYEYCAFMKKMAVAIGNCDSEGLRELTEELDRRSFL